MDTTRDIDLTWRKSDACPGGPTCVEVAALPEGGMAVRDGKNPDGPVLRFDAGEWAAFVVAVRAGEFDR